MKLTRRQFNQTALALGFSLTGGRFLTACGSGDDDGAGDQTEFKTLHFDLSGSASGATHVLHAGGVRYPLQRHTAETRAEARRHRPGLHNVPDRFLTHFADAVEVSKTRVHRVQVRVVDPMRGPGLALVAMYIPTEARSRQRRLRGVGQPPGSGSANCYLQDQVEDDYINGRSAAKALITHHPDLVNVDPDVAAAIETHMDGDQAAAVDNLTLSICQQGSAYEHDPAFTDGWCVLVPMRNADDTPLLDEQGEQVWDYKFSERTSVDMGPAIEALLGAVKNDASLNGEQYQVIYHGDPVDEEALPEATPTQLNGEEQLALANPNGLLGSGGGVTFSTTGYHHNVLFYDSSYSAIDRTFSLKILNLNFIWYGLYLEYLDADGNPISNPTRSSFLNELLASGLDCETDTLKFWDCVSAPPTVFGVPIPFPYQISVKLPDGAAQCRLSLIGPGANGAVEHGLSLLPGIALTAVLNFGVPMYFITKATGEVETKSLVDLFKQPGIILKCLLAFSQLISEATDSNTNDLGIEGSLESLFVALLQDVAFYFNFSSTLPELWEWMGGQLAEAEAVESTPFVGWVMRIIAILGTAGDIQASLAEVCTNPLTISNTVSFTSDVTVVISHDPEDFEFPLIATHYMVQITAGAKAIEPPTIVPISDEERSNDTLTAIVPNVPTTGAPATVSVIFLAANGYPIAHSAAVDENGVPIVDENGNRVPGDITFLNRLSANGDIVVEVPIVENPVPIDADTVYTHHHKLEYASGRYHWNYTTSPPALEPAVCGGVGLCDLGNVTVWVPGGMIGYSWLADSPAIDDCTTGAAGQLYNFQNLSLKNDPNVGRKTPGCGFPGATPITYDARVPVGEEGWHFYLDPVRISDLDPVYHLRRLVLDDGAPIMPHTDESWGRFRIPVDRMAVYSKGAQPKVVGISARFHKISVLEIPSEPYIGDDFANNAKIMSAQGEGNDGLIFRPLALTIADNGAILVLQGGVNKSVKAFDFDGKPWKFFAGGTASVMPLAQDASSVTWLDITIDPTNLLYVLSHTGAGNQRSDFRLDVYNAVTGEHIVRNTGIAVGRIVVDKFRGLYSLNYETVKGSPIVEPSVSVWAPSPPAP